MGRHIVCMICQHSVATALFFIVLDRGFIESGLSHSRKQYNMIVMEIVNHVVDKNILCLKLMS